MLNALTIIVAWLSLFASAFTIWFTMLRRGKLRMTQPAFVLFATDCEGAKAKVAVDAHLYMTAQRAAIVEAMFARVTRGAVSQDFDVWVYGKRSDCLTRGSAIHVGQEGVTGQHHFLLSPRADFAWTPGDYTVEIFGTVVGRSCPQRFWQLTVTLDQAIGANAGVFFNWRPGIGSY